MASPNVIPNANNEGRVGKSGQQWSEVRAQSIYQNGNQVANLASPALTGTPTAPTPATSDNSTKIATSAWVRNMLSNDGHIPSGAFADGQIPAYSTATSKFEAVTTLSFLLDRSNHTGTDAQTDVDNNSTLGYPGATTLADDLIWLNSLVLTNASNIALKADASHTHPSSEISDATNAATASKVVIRGTGGEAAFSNTAALGAAVDGQSSGSGGVGVYGANSGASGIGVHGYQALSGGAAVLGEGAAGTTGVPLVGRISGGGTQNLLVLSNGLVWGSNKIFTVEYDGDWRRYEGGFHHNFTCTTPTADRTVTFPDGSGTVTLGDGTGITSATAFRAALGVGTANAPIFLAVQVTASTSDGIRFGASAKLAMESAASTTTWQLPSGGGATEKLVDGDGRGITDASLFRTAIGAASSSGGTFTGTMIIDPASGSNQLQLVGAGSFAVTLSANPTAARAIAFPDVAGTIVVTSTGSVASTDVSDSTATGRSLMTAASAAAARTTLGSTTVGDALFVASSKAVARAAMDAANLESNVGYMFAYNNGAGVATAVAGASTWYDAEEGATGTFVLDSSFFTTETRGTYIGFDYVGTPTQKFWIEITASFTSASASQSLQFGVGKNGTVITGTEIGVYASSTQEDSVNVKALVSLATNDDVTLMLQNRTGANNVTIEDVTFTIRPFLS